MTPKQKRVLDFIRAYTQKNEISPTQTEIAENLGYARFSSVGRLLDRLVDQGYLNRERGRWRGLSLTDKGEGPKADDEQGKTQGSNPAS